MPGTAWLRWLGRVYTLLFSLFMLAPIVVVLVVSFTGESFTRFPPRLYSVRWYVAAAHTPEFVSALGISVTLAVIVTVAAGSMGIAAAMVLSRWPGRMRTAIVGLVTMPLTLPHIVLAIALLQLFAMAALPSAPYAILFGHIVITAPYVVRLTMSGLLAQDRRLELASYTLGASRLRTWRRIVLPLAARGMVAGLLFAFMLSFDEVTIALFASLPGNMTLPAEIFSAAETGADPVIAAASGLMILISAVFLLLIEALFGVLRLMVGEETKSF